MNRASVADVENARRPPPDPPLPMGFMWMTAKMGGVLAGRYLARASILDWNRNYNNGRTIRFDTPVEAERIQRSFHLEDDTVIEKTHSISGRRGRKLKYQYVIRRTYYS